MVGMSGWVVVDVETSGMTPAVDRVLSVAAVVMGDDGEVVGWIDMTVAEPLVVPIDRLGRPLDPVDDWHEAEQVLGGGDRGGHARPHFS